MKDEEVVKLDAEVRRVMDKMAESLDGETVEVSVNATLRLALATLTQITDRETFELVAKHAFAMLHKVVTYQDRRISLSETAGNEKEVLH